MKKSAPFQIRPVKRYNRARYGSESPGTMIARACWLACRFPQQLVRGMVTALLIAGLSLSGCGGDSDDEVNGQDIFDRTDGVPPNCSDIYCVDDQTLRYCDEYGMYEDIDCDTFCIETHGDDYRSPGCNSEATDPCQCVPGDGDIDEDGDSDADPGADGDRDDEQDRDNELDGEMDGDGEPDAE